MLVNLGTDGPKINQLGSLPSNVSLYASGNAVYIDSSTPYDNINIRILPII